MSYTVGDIRRWDMSALIGTGHQVGRRRSVAEAARRNLSDGAAALDEGWDGHAATSVLEVAEGEKQYVTHLSDGLEDLVGVIGRAAAALGPAVQSVKNRIAEAEAAGLVVTDVAVESNAGGIGVGGGSDQAVVDLHAEVISSAAETVRSLDEHYGQEIGGIAARLQVAIPPVVDRSPIPGPDDPWPGRGVDVMTSAMAAGNPKLADELDPATRGKHKLNPVPDDFGAAAGKGLRLVGRVARPVGIGVTVNDGVQAYAAGKTSTPEAVLETGGALGGGLVGGMAAGAISGSVFGPVGTFIGAGIGAAVGTYLGQKTGDVVHEEFFIEESEK